MYGVDDASGIGSRYEYTDVPKRQCKLCVVLCVATIAVFKLYEVFAKS